MHPAAPTPPVPRQSKARILIVGVTIVAVVAMIAVTAFFLRQRPEDLTSDKSAPVVAPVTNVGKITGRIEGDGKAPASNPLPEVPVAVVPIPIPGPGTGAPPPRPGPSAPAAPAPSPAGPAKPAPAPLGTPATPAPGPATPSAPAPASRPAPAAPAVPVVPVTYRAALLVQGERTGNAKPEVKTYIGTVVWRLDSVSGDPGQPLQTALRADIDIPDAKVKVSLLVQKNNDPALSASHTLVLGFTLGPGSVFKGVRSIQVPQMRDEASGIGEAFVSIGVVPITPTYFLVGMQQSDQALMRNLDLLKTRNWIDVQFVLDDGRAAKITFEKGAQGQRDLLDALAAWK